MRIGAGKVLTIQAITRHGNYIVNESENYWCDAMLETKIVSTKSDLKNGMVVEYSNGSKRMVVDNSLFWEQPKEEPIKEMTVEQIEKELGYKIKIVGNE